MIEPLNIVEQIKLAVSLAEGQFREFKSAMEGPPGSKRPRSARTICQDVGEAMVAFANADGGELIIGVEDDGEISGIDGLDTESLERIKLAYKTHVHTSAPIPNVICRTAEIGSRKVIYFRVPKSTTAIHLTSDGRCLRRSDLETIPASPEKIIFDRREIRSREYDREFVDGCSMVDLDATLVKLVADQIATGISNDRCLQYLGLAEYDGVAGLRLRRAAALLFAKEIDKWHPRLQVRILRVQGTTLGVGAEYNVKNDETVKANIVSLIDETWERIRPHLVETRFQEDARFRSTFIYPEVACREALVNAIAHRDYSDEGQGIEVYVFDDRIEVKNPGNLLSSITISEIRSLTGAHQSRNSYVARTLREIGLMRELGEGMRRIFEVMRHSEMAEPEITSEGGGFQLKLLNKAMYNREEALFIDGYKEHLLSPPEKSVVLMGRRGELISAEEIWTRLGIVDTEHYRLLIDSLQKKGILVTEVDKSKVSNLARRLSKSRKSIPRFRILGSDQVVKKDKRIGGGKSARMPRGKVKEITKADSDDRVAVNSELEADAPSIDLFVGNIPPNTSERDISLAFSGFPPLDRIVIPRSVGGMSRGYAFVSCQSEDIAKGMMQSEVRIGGRRVSIKRRAR